MACGFACFAYLSNIFALSASITATGEVGQLPQRDLTLFRASVAPSIVLSERSRRGTFALSYTPGLAYVPDPQANTRQVTISHRVGTAFTRKLGPRTNLMLNGNFVTGTFDAVALRQQLQNTSNAGTPVTSGTFTTLGGSLGVTHAFSRRWALGVTLDGSRTEADSRDRDSVTGATSLNTNAALIGRQRRAALLTQAGYALTPRVTLQATGIVGYQLAESSDMLALSLTGGTGVALSKTTNTSIAAGVAGLTSWPGQDAPRRYRTFGGTANASISHQLIAGRNATGFAFTLGWAPQYDPIADRTRTRVTLTGNLTWKPAKKWTLGFGGSASTATDGRPTEDVLVGTRRMPAPDTRISFALPINYEVTRWFSVAFGARANLPASNLSKRFVLVDPDYFAFLGLILRTPLNS